MFSIYFTKKYFSLQPKKKLNIEISADTEASTVVGYAVLLTNRLISISTDGHRHFDLI